MFALDFILWRGYPCGILVDKAIHSGACMTPECVQWVNLGWELTIKSGCKPTLYASKSSPRQVCLHRLHTLKYAILMKVDNDPWYNKWGSTSTQSTHVSSSSSFFISSPKPNPIIEKFTSFKICHLILYTTSSANIYRSRAMWVSYLRLCKC